MRRNAVLGSAAFQRWAMRTPLFRGVARRRAAAQFDLIAGFVYSQILAAFVEAGLIGHLQGELRSFDEIAELTGLSRDATDRLLKAGAALKIAESPQPGLWTLGEAGAPLSANAGALAMIRHHRLLYGDLADPLALLAQDRREQTALSAFWSYASKDAGGGPAASYSALMAATQPMVSQQVVDSYDFSAHRRMLDIGGGSGSFVAAVAAAAPGLRVAIFDLPEVIGRTARLLSGGSAGARIDLHAGSFKADALPQGFDLITLVRILHDHDDAVVQSLLSDICNALPDRGRLLIVEPMAESPGAKPMGHGYFGLYLWAMGSGRPRAAAELKKMLTEAGFREIRVVRTALPLIASALVAIK
jgi:demethylspheroidene O-methyltransferase